MQKLSLLLDLVTSRNGNAVDKILNEDTLSKLIKQYEEVRKIIEQDQDVYGFTTVVGHKDNEDQTDGYLFSFLKSHLLGYGSTYSDEAAKFITYCKILSWGSTFTGVDPNLYIGLVHAANDPNFKPSIPKSCSYSSGDVIPATHLMYEYIKYKGQLNTFSPYNIMPFINGHFVQVGFAASLLGKINKYWVFYLYTTLIASKLFTSNHSNYHLKNEHSRLTKYLDTLRLFNATNKRTQDILSIRSIPNIVNNLHDQIWNFCEAIDQSLSCESGNPLFSFDYDSGISQSSFLNIKLTQNSISLLNSIDLATSSAIKRTKYLLSGRLDGICADASLPNHQLGLIQLPKIMMAKHEKIAILVPPASMYAVKSTSDDIEDVWTNGLLLLENLDEILDIAIEVMAIEIFCQCFILKAFDDINTHLQYLSHLTEDLINIVDCESYCCLENNIKKIIGHYDLLRHKTPIAQSDILMNIMNGNSEVSGI